MKQFQFSLQSVLQLRAGEQQKAREAYAAALHVRALAAEAVARAQSEVEACQAALLQRRSGSSNRNEQLLMLNALQYQRDLCQRLTVDFAKADREAQSRCAAMLTAQRKYEAMLRLRNRHQRAHEAKVRREEEAEIADMINSRHFLGLREVAQ